MMGSVEGGNKRLQFQKFSSANVNLKKKEDVWGSSQAEQR